MAMSLFSIVIPSDENSPNTPKFPFAEKIKKASAAYRFSTSGTFLVAPEAGPMPRFAFDFHCPDILSLSQDSLRELLFQLNSVSSGFLWFDSSETDSQALAMRTRLRIKVSSILYSVSETFELTDKNFAMRRLEAENRVQAVSLLGASISSHGGIDEVSLDSLLHAGAVSMVLDNEAEVGVATILPLANDFVSVGGIVKEGQQHRSVDMARSIFSEVIARGKKPLYGVSSSDERGCAVAHALGLSPVRFSYIAQLGDF